LKNILYLSFCRAPGKTQQADLQAALASIFNDGFAFPVFEILAAFTIHWDDGIISGSSQGTLSNDQLVLIHVSLLTAKISFTRRSLFRLRIIMLGFKRLWT
jgi:hypothetical protein